MGGRRGFGLAAALLFIAAPVVASRADTMTMSPALKALADAADKEGQVVVIGSADSWGGPKGAKLIEANINKMFGTHISVVWAPGGSYPETGNNIAISVRNNLPSPTDVYLAFSRNLYVLKKFDLFQTGDWSNYLPGRLDDQIVEEGKYVKIYTGTLGFTYNTEQAPSKPEKLDDFLKPEWKGKIATTSFASGFEQLASKEAWGPERTIAYAKRFAQQLGGYLLCTEPERVASGEFLAFATDCGGGSMEHAAQQGAPIRRVITPDYPMVSYFYGAIPKNAVHPNAAKLYVTYLLTPEGQQLDWEMNVNDLHFFPTSHMRAKMEAVEKKYGFNFGSADVAWQTTNEAGNAAQREVAKIFQESGK